MINNALTIDVEDYFHVHAFSNVIRYQDWVNYECRIERNTYTILDILNNAKLPNRPTSPANRTRNSQLATRNPIKATFFILGWIAERYPGLVRDIAAQGHEVASHGYRHELVTNQTPDEFRTDVAKTKKMLEDITGEEVVGYRASTYSIMKKTLWALRVLAEEGYRYDSSIFPVHHDVYGFPEAPRFPFKVSLNGRMADDVRLFERLNDSNTSNNSNDSNILWEFPISTGRLLRQNIPIAGGGYFRLFPYWLVKRLLGQISRTEQRPFIFYLHPWEFDPDQPKINGAPLRSRLRHYLNLDKVENRFQRLLSDFNFVPIRDLMEKKPSTPFASPR